jgi:hypothetical protein
VSPNSHSSTPKLQLNFTIPPSAFISRAAIEARSCSANLIASGALSLPATVQTPRPRDGRQVPRALHLIRHHSDDLVSNRMTVSVVDLLETIDIEHNCGKLASGMGSRACSFRSLEERAAIEQAGQRIGRCEASQVALHQVKPLRRPYSGQQFFHGRRLADVIVRAPFQGAYQFPLLPVRRHDDDVDRPVRTGKQPRLAAQIDAGHRRQFDAGEQRIDILVF